MSTKHLLKTNQREAGMVAIMVTMILMIVISLIVLGFAQISRRNQRQALDRQLSTQAFYAAETGINDATELIKTAAAAGNTVAEKPDCNSDGGGFYAPPDITPIIDDANNVEYTCLMVDPTPPTLVYSSIGGTGTIVPIIASSGTLASLTLTWQTKDDTTTPGNNCPTSTNNVFGVSSAAGWPCGYGIVRFDMVPTGGSLSHSNLKNGTMTSFLVPIRPGTPGTISSVDDGALVNGGNNRLGVSCTNTNCSLTITGLTDSEYAMRITSLYKDVSLQINAIDGGGGAVEFRDAQAVIDATGKAQDVLRRIQVRVPINGSSTNLLSDYAIQSTDAICKRFSVMDGRFTSEANSAVPGVGAAHIGNPLCQTP